MVGAEEAAVAAQVLKHVKVDSLTKRMRRPIRTGQAVGGLLSCLIVSSNAVAGKFEITSVFFNSYRLWFLFIYYIFYLGMPVTIK